MKILYVCTHNRCRSILCEAITRQLATGGTTVASAGSMPADQVHPQTLQYLHEADVSTAGLHSKSWDDLAEYAPDLVITVCDAAARESCPLWLGSAMKLHWGLADPSKVEGTEEDKAAAFRVCIQQVRERAAAILALAKEYPDDMQAIRRGLIAQGAQA